MSRAVYLIYPIDCFDKKVGIIGLGKVGDGLYKALEKLDIYCIAHAPLIAQDSYGNMTSLE
ncbi:MAG: phosphoglycerate dehydrogenase-like enzyme [Chitinophagales bacterium]